MSSYKFMEPLQLGSIGQVKNRLALAAMTRARTNNEGHVPNDLNLEYYKQRSTAGFILTEGTHISGSAIGWVDVAGIFTEAQAEGWKKITSAVDTPMVCQLWHQGRQSHPSLIETKDGSVVAPSAVAAEGEVHIRDGKVPFPVPRALETQEVSEKALEYGQAAKLAIEKAGFAGVEIHAANGYLIDQFMQSRTNKRTDKYGGSLDNRLQFLQEVISAVTEHVPANKVGIKLSPNGVFGDMGSPEYLELFDAAITIVAERRLAFIEIMDGLAFGAHEFVKEEPYTLERARGVLTRVQGANPVTKIIGNCGYDKAMTEAALKAGHADMISIGRPYIANPDLPQRWAAEAELNEDKGPQTWMSHGVGSEGYTNYPTLPQ